MNEREGAVTNTVRSGPRVSLGLLLIVIVISFVAGNRFQSIGDYFFAPYTNKGGSTLPQSLDLSSVEKIYDLLKKKYDGKLDIDLLQDGLSRGLVDSAGDSYTTYMSSEEAQEFQSDLDGTFSGIGAELGKRNDRLVVIAPVQDAPAQKEGIRAGDEIILINDEDATGLSIDAAVSKIRGEAGTDVKLGLMRNGEPYEVSITRANISIPSVESEILEGGIGYMQITRFSDDTASLAQEAAERFKNSNVKGVVVDVRNNGGGLLDASVQVAGIWLDNKVVVEEKQGGRTTAALRTGNNPPLKGVPTIVLINEGSASASEILAGALHDHGAAKLLGDKTFGKGSVQELIDLDGGAKLKVTVARWFTPNGKNIDKEGIKPDISIKYTDEDFDQERDPQKDRAVKELR